jgi:PKD repeat protein
VQALDPYLYYRLAEPSGTTANDSGIRVHTGDYAGSSARGQNGIVAGNAAVSFSGAGSVSNRDRVDAPGAFSLETWVNTTTSSGGALIGFGSSRTGLSATTDRQVYLRDDGRLAFRVGGVYPAEVVGAGTVNDGQWHHVVATQGPDGMALYVDGTLVGSAPNEVAAFYRGYWRIGGDSAPPAASADYFTGRLDEAAVYDTALTPAQVLQHLQLGGGAVTNVPPTAAFSASGGDLTLSFDGTDSDDPDGTIETYAWDFGDGESASGPSPTTSHTYDAAGLYTVTLTVTDDDGGIGEVSHSFDVTANAPPTAAFTSGINGLAVTVDGSGSDDPDGTIDLYSWDFGDGGTATGETAGHTYAAGGTYTITLTVTDDDGATGSMSSEVTVTPPVGPTTHAADAFERSVATGMGSADTGGGWSVSGSSANYSVEGGTGRHRLGAARWTLSSYLNSVSARDVVATVDVALDKAPTGGTQMSLAVRRIGSSEYRVAVRANQTKTTLTLSRVLNGSTATVAGVTVPGGLVYNVGDVLRIKLQAIGDGTTSLGAKVWKVGSAEPATWQVSGTDSTPALQASGGVGLVSFLFSPGSEAPVVVHYDDLLVTSP